MNLSRCLKLLVLLAIALSNRAAPLKSNLVRFYPISQAQYDSILRMTAGRPVISEGRLINNGFRTLNELRSSISNDLSSGWRQLLNVTGFLPANAKVNTEKVDGYPLCVIKTNEVDYNDDEEDEDDSDVDSTLSQSRAEDEENDAGIDKNRPIVSCIVVVKSKVDEMQEDHVEQPHNVQNLRNPVVPYYYPPYVNPFSVYPAYHPFYNYPYYAEARQNTAPQRVRKPAMKFTQMRRKSAAMQRSSNANGIRAETSKDDSTGRSGYSSYYPYSYGNYGNYYQQGYPYGSYYGGCHGNPYNYFGREDGDDDSGEEKNISGEVAGEIGGDDF